MRQIIDETTGLENSNIFAVDVSVSKIQLDSSLEYNFWG